MLKLGGGQVHHHSPTGIAVKTPARVMEDTDNSPAQDAMQESGSHTLSEDRHNPDFDEAPQNTWSDAAETQADKRRKMNRESARRTRYRKQQQMASLKLEVATLKADGLRSGERLRAITEKNQELAIEMQSTTQHNQMLIKCIGELTVVCKRREGIVESLRHRIQTAERLSDVPVPDLDQIEHQLSADSLRLLQAQPLQLSPASMDTSSDMRTTAPGRDTAHSFAAELTPTATAYMSAAAPSLTSVPVRAHDAATAYLPASDPGLMQPPPLKAVSLPNNTLRAGLVRSHSLHALPCPSSTRMLARPGQYEQDPISAAGTSRASSAPGLASPQQGLYQAKPQSWSVLSGSASLPFSTGNRGPQMPASEASAHDLLMREVNKVEQGFNPQHAHWLAGQSANIGVQQSTSALVLPEKKRPVVGVYDLMDRSVEWRVHHAAQQQQHRRPPASLMPGASQDPNALLIPALDCGQQLHMASFKQTPLPPRNEHAIVHNDYSPY